MNYSFRQTWSSNSNLLFDRAKQKKEKKELNLQKQFFSSGSSITQTRWYTTNCVLRRDARPFRCYPSSFHSNQYVIYHFPDLFFSFSAPLFLLIYLYLTVFSLLCPTTHSYYPTTTPTPIPAFFLPPSLAAVMPHGDIASRIEYSEKYYDEKNEYRHVILPRELAKQLPKNRLLNETEWRGIGVQQSRGWVHYAIHKPEPHILLFRRALGTDPTTGKVDPALKKQAVEKYKREYGQ
jgi:cyclin-dependent kinase regulatory subunit CKS1